MFLFEGLSLLGGVMRLYPDRDRNDCRGATK